MRPDARWASTLAAFTLACMLAVIAASASVRLATKFDGDRAGEPVQAARLVRQTAGGVAALGVLSLAVAANAVRATRGAVGPAAVAALAVTITLSAIGWIAGREPPPAAAFVNQFGGVLLAGLLGWMLGRMRTSEERSGESRMLASVALGLALAQAGFGGAIATFTTDAPVLLLVLHAAAGLAAAACIFAVAWQCGAFERALLLTAAAAVPGIGMLSALHAPSSAWQTGHAFAAALLLAAASYAQGRFARA